MKHVSFKVAKKLKEIGCPQGITEVYDAYGNGPAYWTEENTVDAPTYIDVWLWLWREKDIRITALADYPNGVLSAYSSDRTHIFKSYDPEEAIVAAIAHLVDNDLIK